jgi:hypothetical protein
VEQALVDTPQTEREDWVPVVSFLPISKHSDWRGYSKWLTPSILHGYVEPQIH